MSTRSLFTPLLAVVAVAVAVPGESQAAEPAEAARAKSKRVVVSPRPGQVVHWHHVRLRVRSRTLDDGLRARLNGRPVGGDFGRPRHGVRTLRASLSHGLRRGRNVLRVTVRPRGGAVRTANVRFVVRTNRHLIGAGRDRFVAVGGKVRVHGAVRTAAPGGAATNLGWTVVRAPRRSTAHRRRLGAAPTHSLNSPDGSAAGFRPRVPGSYTLRLSAGGASRAASDTVILHALPRNLLVPIDTMTAKDDANGDQRGIRVGDTTYLLRDAAFSTPSGSVLQALVLKRNTLEFVSNRKYLEGSALAEDLSHLDSSYLVIVVLQPGGLPGYQYPELGKAVGQIGVEDMGASLPKNTGLMSVIGVPGMDPGDADVNILTGSTGPIAPMKGHLVRDQYDNFGYVSSKRRPFSFTPKPAEPCSINDLDCLNGVGFRIHNLDSRTLAPGPNDARFYATGSDANCGPAYCSEIQASNMARDLDAIDNDNVVMIESVSSVVEGFPRRPPISGRIAGSTMVRLANAVARVGGSRNGFNRIAVKSSSAATGGLTYALVGWKGAREGTGAEAAAGVDGAGETATLSGMLQPDRQSRLRPAAADTNPEALSELVLDEPTQEWPLSKECRPAGMAEDDPGATRAIAAFGRATGLGPDPRATYALQANAQSEWERIAGTVKQTQYTDIPASFGDPFTEPQFLAARCQLVRELGWVGSVRGYLEKLKKPIKDAGGVTYSDLQTIGDRIFEDAKPVESKATLVIFEMFEVFLDLAGPVTHEVSATVAGMMHLGMTSFEASEDGGPSDEVQFKARELADKLVKEMLASAQTLDAMGDVIVSDSAKLSFVGEHGGCVPTEPTCPKGYSFTSDDTRRVYADLYRGLERVAYTELLPFSYDTSRLNLQHRDAPPDLRWEYCFGLSHPFWYYSAQALATASTAEMLELAPQGYGKGKFNRTWQLLVLARPEPSAFALWRYAPSDKVLKRMFTPVPASDNPTDGGLGLQPGQFLRTASNQRSLSNVCS